MENDKEKLRNLILALLHKGKELAKVKLAKLVLFADIEHFKRTGKAITGLYYVRLKNGPVVAFYDAVLEDGEGTNWNRKSEMVAVHEEGREKAQYSYTALAPAVLSKEELKTVDAVFRNYGKKSGSALSVLSHELPAWRFSEPNEPIFITELAVKNEREYFALTDLVESLEGEENELAEKVPRSLPQAKVGI
jgi:uncharacterized phage-associated protein